MSGQPYIYPTDINKYRQQYLANLNLRAIIDDKNLQANKVYKQTGAPTQPTDFRTTSEKYADIERAKVDARKRLLEITTGDEIDIILSRLDPSLLSFLLDRINFIISDLKDKYARGVPATIFLPYLQKLERKARETQDVEYGLQETTGRDILLSTNDIRANLVSPAQIDAIKNIAIQGVRGNARMETQLSNIFAELETANETMLEAIEAFKKAEAAGGDINELASLQEQMSRVNEEMLSRAEAAQILEKLQRGEATRDRALVQEALMQFQQKTLGSGDVPQQMAQILDQMIRIAQRIETPMAPVEVAQKPEWRGAYTETNKKPKGAIIAKIIEIFNYSIGKPLRSIFDELGPGRDDAFIRNAITKLRADPATAFLTKHNTTITNALRGPSTPIGVAIAAPVLEGTAAAATNVPALEEGELTEAFGFKHLQANRRIGKGIYQPAKRYDIIKKEQIDYTKGIEPVKKWVKFGKNVINISKLNDDIISVKREKGSGISGIKAMRVSKKLGNVMRKIVGNGFPSFEELQNLDTDEKDYLYKVVKASDLLEKLNIPTPSKDEEEKDIHQFELMKGQILAGNNNNELIKKFKTLLMKLMQRGSIPKSQAKDILLDLTESGF